ncbi:MAG: adenylate/guanylate cyclase domain-containing protein [Candidatus Nitrotoga sp.]
MTGLSEVLKNDADVADAQDRLRRSLLVFACALMICTVMLWLAMYWMMGLKYSTNVPLAYQIISITSLVIYLKNGNFVIFRFVQLSLFLFAPFIMQWSIGSSATSSGLMLWALLSPIAAIVVAGWRESIPWFVAYVVLTVMTGFFDYLLGVGEQSDVSMRAVGVFFAINFTAMSSILYVLLRYFVLETEKIRQQLGQQHQLLADARNQSEHLLLNVLPAHIAHRLKNKQGLIADAHPDVTVMFADIVNFTQLAEQLSPDRLIALLNTIFSWLDSFSEKHGLEKIKTIGDAYMVAGGLTNNPNHVNKVADMALEIRSFIATHPELSRYNLGIHIGIATGTVVAGVIGTKRFIYDLWGDTVNTASRLADYAEADQILVDINTYTRLRANYQFDTVKTTYLKGKGEIAVYELLKKVGESHKEAAVAPQQQKVNTNKFPSYDPSRAQLLIKLNPIKN